MTIDPDLAEFCDVHRPRIVGLLALYLGDRDVAEELGQEALVRLCQHWPRVRAMADPRAWLHRVAFNLARSWFRRQAAARRAHARHGGGEPTVHRDEATVLAVRAAVHDLPPRMRQAVICRHFLGMSVREAAAAMGCAEGTVKSLTARGLASLREAGLGDDAGADDAGADGPGGGRRRGPLLPPATRPAGTSADADQEYVR